MGMIEDEPNRMKISKLLLFKSYNYSEKGQWIDFEQYISEM